MVVACLERARGGMRREECTCLRLAVAGTAGVLILSQRKLRRGIYGPSRLRRQSAAAAAAAAAGTLDLPEKRIAGNHGIVHGLGVWQWPRDERRDVIAAAEVWSGGRYAVRWRVS